ncbi:MAG TPA: serine/threonine-protein kinase [Thermoleophilaceae bacterium]|nr:serine/threonine-protein kinase [Thermoleophilaceae bacterium]
METVAGHRIEGVAGEGGSSVVYRCAGGVAVKVLREELRSDAGVVERFRGEAEAAGAVDHTNVVELLDAGDWWIAMRFVDGPSLLELAPLGRSQAVAIVSQAAAALDAVHAAGYVHRDVKPGNLLVDSGGRVHLVDFALARRINDPAPWVTGEGNWLGTPVFAAPEQIRGEPMDARSEVYALGGVLHWALRGEVPFPRADAEATMRAHLSEPPPAGDPVVERAMAKDPAARYPSAGELAAALAAT